MLMRPPLLSDCENQQPVWPVSWKMAAFGPNAPVDEISH